MDFKVSPFVTAQHALLYT